MTSSHSMHLFHSGSLGTQVETWNSKRANHCSNRQIRAQRRWLEKDSAELVVGLSNVFAKASCSQGLCHESKTVSPSFFDFVCRVGLLLNRKVRADARICRNKECSLQNAQWAAKCQSVSLFCKGKVMTQSAIIEATCSTPGSGVVLSAV